MLVFKYLLTIAYKNRPVKKCALSLCTIRRTRLRNYQKIKDTCLKSFDGLQCVVETEMNESLLIHSI